MSCLACAGSLIMLGRQGRWRYAACRACGAVQLSPPPDPDRLASAYAHDYVDSGHPHADAEANRVERGPVLRQVADEVCAALTPGADGCVLEIGAGFGNLGHTLRRRGVCYVGLEPSEVMAAHAAGAGLDVRIGRLQDAAELSVPGPVRVVVSMAVYEHLPDPTAALAQMAARLHDGNGAIVIQAPTAGIPRWVGRAWRRVGGDRDLPRVFGSLAAPWHVCLPTPASLAAQAHAAGLCVHRVVPSVSGRRPGLPGLLQRINDGVAFGGHRLFGPHWPLSMAHIFVLRTG